MNVYITKTNGVDSENLLQHKQQMIVDIAHQLGCQEMGIYRYDGRNESADSLNGRLDGIIAGIQWGEDVVICQFPTGNGFKYEWELVNRIKSYQCRVVIYIHVLESIVRESNRAALPETIRLYNQAEVLIVPSLAVQQFLVEHGIRKEMKFLIQEMLDYTIDRGLFSSPQFHREIHFTGNGGIDGVSDWSYAVPLKLYTDLNVQGQNVHYRVGLSQGELICGLSKGGFGLIWYQDEDSRQMIEYGVSFDMSRYLAAGIPVIAPRGISNQALIEKNNLGMIVDSLEKAVEMIDSMRESEYQAYVSSVGRFAPMLRNGYYTKKCLIDVIHAICRKDKGDISAPAGVYGLGECNFTYVILKESYRENLALSWSYNGKTDGFLIYDTFGKLIYETENVYQHYFLIKGYRKESGFIIKTFVDTLSGRLVVAESESVYLQAEKNDRISVSMIIPAYNAENYIARSIDTVLAQSFPDLELIIVDDKSTDHTLDLLDWYAEKYSNVKVVVHQENRGPAATRNTGIELAHGEYIGFMDNDDMIRPEMVAKLYNSMKKNDCDIAITSVYRIEETGYKEYVQYPMDEDIAVPVDDFLWMHFRKGLIFSVMIWNKLYRASLVKEHPLPLMSGDDGAWTPYILSYADRICYLNDRSYEYDRVIRENTLEDKWMTQSRGEQFTFYKNIVTFYLKNGNPEKMEFLKELARCNLIGWGRIYAYDEYEKFWEQIKDKNL